MPTLRGWLIIVLVTVATNLFFSSSLLQHAKLEHGTARFKGSIPIMLLFGIVGPMGLYGAIVSLTYPHPDWLTSIILGGLGIASIAMWPQEIIVSPTEISKRGRFWLGRTVLPWTDVDYATHDPVGGNTEVVSKEGKKILFTPFHAARSEFILIVRQYCRWF